MNLEASAEPPFHGKDSRSPTSAGFGILVSVFAIFSGCGETPRPKDALLEYFRAIASADLASAFNMLTAESRRTLEGLARRERSSAGGFDLFRSRMTTGGPGSVPWITRATLDRLQIDVVRESAGLAILRVTSPLGSGEVKLSLEDGRWLVALGF